MTNFYRSLILFLCLILSQQVFSQCGVSAVINGAMVGNDVDFDANQSIISPGWNAYAYLWQHNGTIASTVADPAPNEVWTYGILNEVCLTIYAVDSVTGDSCFDRHCNIFQSIGRVYVMLSVIPDPMDSLGIIYQVTQAGIPSFVSYSTNINFGDGNSSTFSSGTHHYAMSGQYTVGASVTIGMQTESILRIINVNNGKDNLFIDPFSPAVVCDSVYMAVSSPSVLTTSYVSYLPMDLTFHPISMNVPFGHRYTVPGQSLIDVFLADSITGLHYYSPVFINECNIIPDTLSGIVWHDVNANGIFDTTELPLANQIISMDNYSVQTDSNGYYQMFLPDLQVTIRCSPYPDFQFSYPVSGTYTIHYHTGQHHTGFDFGVTDNEVKVCGKTFIDIDLDNIYDFGTDIPLVNSTIRALNQITLAEFYTSTNGSGDYCFELIPGDYIIEPVGYYMDSATASPASYNVVSNGGTINFKNFIFNGLLAGCNPQVYIGNSSSPIPGNNYSIKVYVGNTGVDSVQSTVVLTFDPSLTVDDPDGGIVDAINHTITFTTNNMYTNNFIHYNISFLVSGSATPGSLLPFTANVSAGICDNDLTNNYHLFVDSIVNNTTATLKLVSPSEVNNGEILRGQRLHYRINFQNTGADTLKNVFIQDILDSTLDMPTFLMENSSHYYQKITTNGRTITWNFFNINLPDVATNEPASHGFVEFSVLPKQSLSDGTVIENNGYVYYDSNTGIVTNTVYNTLVPVITLGRPSLSSEAISVFPVPFWNTLFIQLPLNTNDIEIEIMDLSGRVVSKTFLKKSSTGNLVSIDLANLNAGMYILQVSNSDIIYNRPIVKM